MEEKPYAPLPEQEPMNIDDSQAIHLAYMDAHYKQTPPKRLAARSADESPEDGTYLDGALCAAFPESAFYTPPVKRPRGRPRKHPLPAVSFAMTS